MKQVFYAKIDTDPSKTVRVDEVEAPSCPVNGVVVQVHARPINPADLLLLTGRHVFTPELPSFVGIEGAGIVVQAGPESQLAVGTPVAIPSGGTWRELFAARDEQLLALPKGIDLQQASMFCVNPFTAFGLLEGVAPESAIVLNAGTSAISKIVLSVCKHRNITAIAVVRDDKASEELIALGASAVVVDGPDLAGRVRKAAAGRKLLLALDAVAGEASSRLFDALDEGATLVVYGLLASNHVQLPAAGLIFRDVTVRGFSRLRIFAAMSQARRVEITQELLSLFQAGSLHTEIEACYPLEEVASAISHHERPGRRGKILLLSE